MALYPTPAGHRMAYDRDGSAAFQITSGVVSVLSAAAAQALNDESNATGVFNGSPEGGAYVGVLFPELRDLVGYYVSVVQNHGSITNNLFQVSTNTTSGLDGTWTTVASPYTADNSGTVIPGYRSSINALANTGIKGVRWNTFTSGSIATAEYLAIHLYGQPATGQNPDSLRVWQPVVDAEVTTVFDFGDIAQGATTTKTFRIKNLSGTKTATSIAISAEALTDASPTLIPQFTFSTDNVTFATSINIGTLAPGATSGVLYVRDTVASSAALSVWALRMVAVPATFA